MAGAARDPRTTTSLGSEALGAHSNGSNCRRCDAGMSAEVLPTVSCNNNSAAPNTHHYYLVPYGNKTKAMGMRDEGKAAVNARGQRLRRQ
jgi:hypothetical protein